MGMRRLLLTFSFAYAAIATPTLWGAMAVTLHASVDSPAPLATKVVWTAQVADSTGGTLWYRFRSRALGSPFETIRDFGPESTLEWTAGETEGLYEVQVTARDLDSGATSTASGVFQMTSRITDGTPVVNPTSNQLVFLYSAPSCSEPGRMRVQFQSADGVSTLTPFKDCLPNSSMNFYLAGLKPSTTYVARHFLDTGTDFVRGPDINFATPEGPLTLAPYTVLQPMAHSTGTGVLLQSTLAEMTVATDLSGNLIWYYPSGISSLARPTGNGRFLGFFENPDVDPAHEYFREFDVAGFTFKESNAARVSEQLVSMGMPSITAFHHEARRLQ